MFLTALQFLIVGVLILSAAWLVSQLSSWVRQRNTATQFAAADLKLFTAQSDLVLERKREVEQVSELAWNSFRKFEVVRKELEAKDTCSFYLAPHDRRPLPPFKPGQFLTFKLDIPGQKKDVIRCYSLSDSAFNAETYRLTVKRVPAPRDQPDLPAGLSSNFFHDHVNELDIIDVKAPSGAFHFDLTRPHPSVLIAGGIGITPLLSMLNSMVETGYHHETWFFYGVRNGEEHAMKEHLQRLDEQHDWLNLVVCYSNPDEHDVEGDDYHQHGRVSVALFKELLPSNNYDFYMCGPPPMMNSVVGDLEAWGVPEGRIHFEAFGPASVKKVKDAHIAEPSNAPAVSFKVTFAKSGKEHTWDGDSDSLLEFAEANDINLDFGCRAGNCGTCLVAIKAGEVELIQDDVGADCEKGSCLTCVSLPKGDLILDA